MANFLNDGSLIGFWPLNEPSGAPFFLNYSPARSRRPSGISFDLHVAQAENQGFDQVKSLWPGTTVLNNPASGVNYAGYMVQGYWKLGNDSSPYSRYLILGDGSSQSREQTLAPNVAQSGFTVGIWVYPNSDGYIRYYENANTGAYNGETEGARAHSLMAHRQFASLGGWIIGVSGALSNAAQFNANINNSGLHAYVAIERNAGTPTVIRTPIESGRYTHLTFSFRYINGTADQIALYKDGRLAASGTSNTAAGGASASTLANTTMTGRALTIGGGDNAAAGANNYSGTSGWDHLVSGAYFFRRVLHEGEILDLHNGSTLQPIQSNIKRPIKVELTDPQLLAHYPFRSVGFPDVSKNHRPLGASQDEGPVTSYISIPGPFGAGALLENGTNANDVMIVPSGLIYDMLNGRSWTIAIVAGPTNAGGRANNMILSFGSVSTVTTTAAPGAISAATFGMALTELGAAPTVNRMRFSAYPLGDITASVFNIDIPNSGYFNGVPHHYAVAYDDSTKGIAAYIDGHLAGSGTLAHSLTDQLIRLAGSGFPLLIGNGITNTLVDATTLGIHAAGGTDMFVGPITIMGRALLPEELMYIAQSGIDTTATWRTPYDARMMGYWPCSDFKLDDIVVEDRARVWDIFPGNLLRGDTTTKWNAFYGNVRINPYNTRNTPPELAGFGVLGITSGVFGVHGLSPGTANVADAASIRSSIANYTQRYKPVNEECDTTPQNVLGEFVIGYEVTPSGTIPSTLLGLTADATKFEFNSTLSLYGNLGAGASNGELRSFLTTIDAPLGSGVSLVFVARGGAFAVAANTTALVSGVVPFGVPSKVLFHSKFDAPYNANDDTAGTTPVSVTLWINGVVVQRRTLDSSVARVWAAGAPNGTADDFLLEFGGEAGNDAITTQTSRDGGLGDIYMREIFLMRGAFAKNEVAALAASGIQNPTIAGYTPTQTKTQVTIGNPNLEGYWRFNGLDGGGSGTRDLSIKVHHLKPFGEEKNRNGQSDPSTRTFRFLPGPLKDSDLLVQCSGLSYTGTTPGATPLAPFAVSGGFLNSPQNGFSVGFLMARRDTPATNNTNPMLTYGLLGSNSAASTTIDFNRGWTILADSQNNVKMVMSVGGNGFYNNTSIGAQSGQIVCGTFEGDSIYEDLTRFNNYLFGNPRGPRLDFWSHYCWTYDPINKELKCYVNGLEVDRKTTKFDIDPLNGGPASGLNPIVPVNPAARMMTFLCHQTDAVWKFDGTANRDSNSVITDVFYFSDELTPSEVRYIAQNGIDGADGTTVSGIIGGYILASEQASGIIGGYNRGQDTASGIIGGWNFGAFAASGSIGGYVSGVVFFAAAPSGSIGGYIHAMDLGSGLIGGYIKGAGMASGILGGFILGGLRNSMQFDGSFVVQAFAAKDFDSQLTIRKNTTSDFDAKLVIFQAETGPLVEIIIPGSTEYVTSAPFNQYFIGTASGTQGKSIVQTRWTFGDLTPAVTVAESGGMGLYPVQHHYAGSGFFIAKFEAIDSNGIHGSATRIINAVAGIDPVIVSLSGVPRSGSAALVVDFTTTVNILPPGVSLTASLLNFDDGQSTITFNPTHTYTEPGVYKPIWAVRDSRGVIWGDSLESGNDFLKGI